MGATRAMKMALDEAGLAPRDIAHINAHATSTPQGDVAECVAIINALSGEIDHVVTTSTKSMTGHLLGGAGALESVATVLALRDRVVPPTVNVDNLDPAVKLDVAREKRTLPAGDIAGLNNSFGFGGHNVAIAFRSV
jgi:3-oxoacyl-[acyl-carrier-protein] synthase II